MATAPHPPRAGRGDNPLRAAVASTGRRNTPPSESACGWARVWGWMRWRRASALPSAHGNTPSGWRDTLSPFLQLLQAADARQQAVLAAPRRCRRPTNGFMRGDGGRGCCACSIPSTASRIRWRILAPGGTARPFCQRGTTPSPPAFPASARRHAAAGERPTIRLHDHRQARGASGHQPCRRLSAGPHRLRRRRRSPISLAWGGAAPGFCGGAVDGPDRRGRNLAPPHGAPPRRRKPPGETPMMLSRRSLAVLAAPPLWPTAARVRRPGPAATWTGIIMWGAGGATDVVRARRHPACRSRAWCPHRAAETARAGQGRLPPRRCTPPPLMG